MKFFEPNDAFLDWLAKHAGNRMVFDVGSGEGHITRALLSRKVKCVGIEPQWDRYFEENRDLVNAIIPTEAEHCSSVALATNSLFLFCRPCHNLFVERTLRRLQPGNEVLYITKPENLGVDFDLKMWTVKKVDAPPCPEERVWQVVRSRRMPKRRC